MKPILTTAAIIVALFLCQPVIAQNCAVNAGLDQTICVNQPLTITALAGTPKSIPAFYQWSQVSGPAVTITNPAQESTTVTGATIGNYVFKFVSRCSDNILAQDFVSITVLPLAPSSLAGADVTQCSNTPVVLNANSVSTPLTGTWTVSPLLGSFTPNANAYNATYTPPAGTNTYTLTWTISNGACTNSDNMLIKVVAPAAVSAGADITRSCNGSCATLNASSPGLAPPQTGIWTVISGPNTPVFSNINLRTSTVCNLIAGTYTLRWTVTGPCSSGFDDMLLNVTNNLAAPTTGTAQTYTTFCNSSSVVSQVLNGVALTAGETALWTQTGGGIGAPYPNVSFTPNTTTASVTVSGLSGTFPYIFSYVRTNAAGCTTAQTHTVYRAPTFQNLTTAPDQELACNAIATTVQYSYNDLPNIITGITRVGTFITGPSTGTITYGTTVANAGTRTDTWNIAALTSIGTYIFKVEYRNACGSVFRDIAITTSRTPGDINAGSDIVLPCNTLTAIPIGNISVPGTYNWTQISGPNTATVTGGNTNTPNMSNLIQGLYRMRIQISGGMYCPSKTDDMLVTVTQNAPTIASTGPNGTVCSGNYQLSGNIPQSWEIGTWTVTPNLGISFFPNANTPNAIASGLADTTTYIFKWTVSNSCGSVNSSQTIVTTTQQSPPPPNAGLDICLPFGSTTTTLNATNSGTATIIWTALTAGSSISTPNTSSTTASFTGGTGLYLFECRLSVAGCNDLADTIAVSINHNSTANAGTDLNICASALPLIQSITGSPVAPAGSTVLWSQLSGPAGANIQSPNSNSTNINNINTGLYIFEYSITAGFCSASTDLVSIRVAAEPSLADAGPDQSKCAVAAATTVTLAAIAPTTGNGYWQIISSPQGAGTSTFSNSNSPTSTITNLTQGTYTLRWTVTNGPVCTDKTDDMVISISAQAFAGTDVNYCNITSINLTGNANTTGTWSFVSGTAGSTITTNSPNTAVVTDLMTSTPSSNYTFRYSLPIFGACPATQDDILIKVYPPPSLANGGSDAELCFNQNNATLTGIAPTTGTASWVWVSGPLPNPTAGVANSSKNDTNLIISKAGLYSYNYSVNTTSPCVASTDQVQIIKEDSARAGIDQQYCNISSVSMAANSPIFYLGTWSYVSGPAGYTIFNINNPTTTVTGLIPGTYIFRWTIGGNISCTENSDDVMITIDPPISAIGTGNIFTLCEGSLSTFTIGNIAQPAVIYAWTPTLFLNDTTLAQPTFSGVHNAGNYSYTVRARIGSCEAFATDIISVYPKPSPLIIMASSGCSAVIFSGQNLNAAVSSSNYSWDFGAGASPATATGAGPHTVSYSGSGNKSISLILSTPNLCSETSISTINGACFLLPILISDFAATWKNEYTALSWKASSALNFSHFEIERSIDGIHFIALNNISLKENEFTYNFNDFAIPSHVTKLFYRLKSIDRDQHFITSQVVVVHIISAQKTMVWPNPFNNKISISIDVKVNKESLQIELWNTMGQLKLKKQVSLQKGKQLLELEHLGYLPNGYYTLRILGNSINESIKLLKWAL